MDPNRRKFIKVCSAPQEVLDQLRPYEPPKTDTFEISGQLYMERLQAARAGGFWWGTLVGGLSVTSLFVLVLVALLLL